MNIKKAIEQAGPGGKITHPTLILCKYWTVKEKHLYHNEDNGGNQVIPTLEHLTATDWEVIADERIEVGDTVDTETRRRPPHGVVIGIDSYTGRVSIRWSDGTIGAWKENDIKLIRKGPKRHVLEGQMFREGRDINGSSVSIPCSFGPPRQLRKFCGKNGEPGKSYRMELIEDGPNGE